jgi:hypothetical protein
MPGDDGGVTDSGSTDRVFYHFHAGRPAPAIGIDDRRIILPPELHLWCIRDFEAADHERTKKPV